MPDDDLTPLLPEERATLDAWRREPPPPELESRVVAALRSGGALAPARRPAIRLALAASVLVALGVAAGYLAGRAGPTPPGAQGDRFLLLLSDAPGVGSVAEAERVKEYGDWARGLAARGAMMGGEKLDDAGETLLPAAGSSPNPAGQAIQGYFVITARDLAEAVALARTCPHLRHGGQITVRPISAT